MDELYREQLLEKYKNPSHKKILIKPDVRKDDANPLCGDTIEIFLRLDNDNKVAEATFEGKGCVISQASADILMDELPGKTLKEIQGMTREDMLDLLGLSLTHTRIKCAMLALTAVKKGIVEYEAKK